MTNTNKGKMWHNLTKIALVDFRLRIRKWHRYFYWTVGALSIMAMGTIVARMVVYSPSQLIIISIGILIILICLMRTWSGLLLLLYFAPFYGFVRWTLEISPVQAMWKEGMVVLLDGQFINSFLRGKN